MHIVPEVLLTLGVTFFSLLVAVDPCAINPCLNGQCVRSVASCTAYTCQCNDCFVGNNCQTSKYRVCVMEEKVCVRMWGWMWFIPSGLLPCIQTTLMCVATSA